MNDEAHLLRALRELIEQQAKDDGLWFVAQFATEGYLQQELRKLHQAVENYLEAVNA